MLLLSMMTKAARVDDEVVHLRDPTLGVDEAHIVQDGEGLGVGEGATQIEGQLRLGRDAGEESRVRRGGAVGAFKVVGGVAFLDDHVMFRVAAVGRASARPTRGSADLRAHCCVVNPTGCGRGVGMAGRRLAGAR